MSFENEDCVSSKHVMLFLISKDVEVCLFTGDIMVYKIQKLDLIISIHLCL